MPRDWEEAIVHRYPYQFSPGFSFEVGDGWSALMEEMCRRVDLVLPDEWKDGQSYRWGQVKEKFGVLSASNTGPDEVDRITDWAEAMSATTCETCGRPGRMRRGGWLSVRCDEHAT